MSFYILTISREESLIYLQPSMSHSSISAMILESVLENEMHKLLRDFEIHTDHQISARQPDLIIINKKKRTCRIVDFAVLAGYRVKLKEHEKRDKYLNFDRELKKAEEHESDDYTNSNWYSWYSHQRISTRTGNNKVSGDHPNYCIIEISQNTEKSPGDLKRCCHSNSSEKPSANTGVKNSQKRTNNNDNNDNNLSSL